MKYKATWEMSEKCPAHSHLHASIETVTIFPSMMPRIRIENYYYTFAFLSTSV